MTHPPTRKRVILQLAALILCAAGVAGFAGYKLGQSRQPQPPPMPRSVEEALTGLRAELALTEAQEVQVRPVLERRYQAQAEHSRAMAARMAQMAAELRALLDPRQQELFDERTRRIRGGAQRHFQGVGPAVDTAADGGGKK